jgi:HAMP domain-containing protein
MEDPSALFALAGTAVAGLGLFSAAALRAWTQWLELRRDEIARGRDQRPSPAPSAEIGELRERVRRLEAIASGTGA